MYIEYLWINSSSAFDNFFLFSLRCSCSVSFEAVFLFLNPAYFCFFETFLKSSMVVEIEIISSRVFLLLSITSR